MLDIQKILTTFINEKIRGVFLFACLILFMISCKQNTKAVVEKNILSDSKLIYDDSILKVFYKKDLNFADSFFYINNRTGEQNIYRNYLYKNSPCFIENDSLKFTINKCITNQTGDYSVITYFVTLRKNKFYHYNHHSGCVYAKSDTIRRDPCELFLNKRTYQIGDTMIGILVGATNEYPNNNTSCHDSIYFKYKVYNVNSKNSNNFYNFLHKIRR